MTSSVNHPTATRDLAGTYDDNDLRQLVPFEGKLWIFVDFFPGKLVFASKTVGFNRRSMLTMVDGSNSDLSTSQLQELLAVGTTYPVQIESSELNLAEWGFEMRLEHVDTQACTLFLTLHWQALPDSFSSILGNANPQAH